MKKRLYMKANIYLVGLGVRRMKMISNYDYLYTNNYIKKCDVSKNSKTFYRVSLKFSAFNIAIIETVPVNNFILLSLKKYF